MEASTHFNEIKKKVFPKEEKNRTARRTLHGKGGLLKGNDCPERPPRETGPLKQNPREPNK